MPKDTHRRNLHSWLTDNATLLGAYSSAATLTTLPLILLGGILAFVQLRGEFAKPDVGLGFYRAQSPQFRVVNLGSTLVHEPKYQLDIYDLNVKADGKPFMILQIPARILDFLNPEDALGPYGIVSLSPRRDAVKDGHHLFGYGQVTCPDCAHFRRYWFYSELGKGGWYAEIAAEEHTAILKRLADIVYSANPLAGIDAIIPQTVRIRIR